MRTGNRHAHMAPAGDAEEARQLRIKFGRGQPIVFRQELVRVHLFARLATLTLHHYQVVSLAGVRKRFNGPMEVPPSHGN